MIQQHLYIDTSNDIAALYVHKYKQLYCNNQNVINLEIKIKFKKCLSAFRLISLFSHFFKKCNLKEILNIIKKSTVV